MIAAIVSALCAVIEPIFDATLLPRSYACRRGKGTHAGAVAVQAELRCIELQGDATRGGEVAVRLGAAAHERAEVEVLAFRALDRALHAARLGHRAQDHRQPLGAVARAEVPVLGVFGVHRLAARAQLAAGHRRRLNTRARGALGLDLGHRSVPPRLLPGHGLRDAEPYS